jgi:hypothetical protein
MKSKESDKNAMKIPMSKGVARTRELRLSTRKGLK